MAKYATRKNTDNAKQETLRRKQARRIKYATASN